MTTLTTTTLAAAATLAAKDRLARLMATENIKVEHDPRAKTASFNVETRTLTMPVWKDMPEATGDMLIAHEVSHALHTPSGKETLLGACRTIDRKNPAVAKDYLNVVEDVRIERMMKARFPGTKGDFAKGYRWMSETDLFGLKNVGSLASLGLIDRINLQYKIGWLVEIPFAADELALAQRAATTVTWDDVVALAKEIYEKAKEQNKNRPQDPKGPEPKPEPQDGDEGDETEAEGTTSEPQDGDEGDETEADETKADEADGDETKATDADGDEADEADGDEADGDEGDETDGDADGDEADGDADGDEGDEGDETDADADADADGDETNQTDETDETDPDDDEGEGQAPVARTLRDVEDALLGRTDATASLIHYADLPEVMKDFVVTRKQVAETLNTLGKITVNNGNTTVAAIAAEMLGAWRTENLGAVQVLATEFDRRKAADEHRRTATSETGSIDPNRLWAYKISDEIFAANAYVKDGKNHGLMLLLDLSASMCGIINDTMAQLVTLAAFCRRVNLPYRFYAFTDLGFDHLGETFKGGGMVVPNECGSKSKVRLLTLLEDGMSLNEWNAQAGLLLAMGYRLGNGSGETASAKVAKDRNLMSALKYATGAAWATNLTGHTPNNTALLGLSQIAQEFKATKRLQVVNMIVLTDGESTDCLHKAVTNTTEWAAKEYGKDFGKNPQVILRDKKTNKTYTITLKGKDNHPLNAMAQTAVMNQLFRDRVGGKVVCIHLTDTNHAVRMQRETAVLQDKELNALYSTDYFAYREKVKQLEKRLTAEWNQKKWASLTGKAAHGYDEYIMVAASTITETVVLTADPTTGAGLRTLRNQFTKQLGATKGNRPLMTRVAELLAK